MAVHRSVATLATMATVATTPVVSVRRFYLPELDALRCSAFVMVLLVHSRQYFGLTSRTFHLHQPWAIFFNGFVQSGVYGVDMFFALSAYLITAILLRERDRTGQVNVRNFYMRRILRIWPLYFCSILLFEPLSRLFLPHESFTLRQAVWFSLLAGNWSIILHGTVTSWLGSLWSLNIEEQFYLLWPLTLRLRSRGMAAIAVALFFGSTVAQVIHLHIGPGVYYDTFTRMQAIACGALFAIYRRRRPSLPTSAMRILSFGAACFLFFVIGAYGAPDDARCLYSFPTSAIACTLMLFALVEVPWTPGRFGRIVVYLGKISYGLYVFHMAGVDLLRTRDIYVPFKVLLTLLGTIAAAALSYQFLEMPFNRIKDRIAPVKSRAA